MSKVRRAVYLEEVEIEGYRSCQNTNFTPNPKLSALIGINGAGKTNTLNAIDLLALPSSARLQRNPSRKEPFIAETRITAWFLVEEIKIGLRLHLTFETSSRTSDEIASYKEEWKFPFDPAFGAWREVPNFIFSENDGQSKQLKDKQHLLFESELMNYWTHLSKHPSEEVNKFISKKEELNFLFRAEVIQSIQSINDFRYGIKYYSASQFTDPTRCPSNFEIDSDMRLERSYRPVTSSTHLKFLYDLYRLKRTNVTLYKEYENFVSRRQLGLISRISWKEIKLSSHTVEIKSGGKIKRARQFKTLIIPKIQIGSSHITFNQLSEGTFKTLAIIFYIMTDTSSCLLIEEPEVCVHHGLLTKIVSTINAYSSSKQVIFSTHSDQVLDMLSHKDVFVVQMVKSQTSVTTLASWVGTKGIAALNAYLEETGTLGEYWRSGGFAS